MDLTINYNHSAKTMSEGLGLSAQRWMEIAELRDEAMFDKSLQNRPEVIEWVINQLKDVTAADLVLVGIAFG